MLLWNPLCHPSLLLPVFNLCSMSAAVDIYAGVASSLGERKKGGQLTEFLKNIKHTIDDDDWDQVMSISCILLVIFYFQVVNGKFMRGTHWLEMTKPKRCAFY